VIQGILILASTLCAIGSSVDPDKTDRLEHAIESPRQTLPLLPLLWFQRASATRPTTFFLLFLLYTKQGREVRKVESKNMFKVVFERGYDITFLTFLTFLQKSKKSTSKVFGRVPDGVCNLFTLVDKSIADDSLLVMNVMAMSVPWQCGFGRLV
jgi:hypothetical protein